MVRDGYANDQINDQMTKCLNDQILESCVRGLTLRSRNRHDVGV